MPVLPMDTGVMKNNAILLKYQLFFGSKGIEPIRRINGKNQHRNNNFEMDLHFCLPIVFLVMCYFSMTGNGRHGFYGSLFLGRRAVGAHREEWAPENETFEKCRFLFTFKEDEKFNLRNILNISRIKF